MPLNVLQVATGFPNWGGTEQHILYVSEHLLRRGHDVTIACRPGRWVEERAQALGIPTVPIRVMNQHDWQDYGLLRSFLREKRIDVMHVHVNSDILVPGFAALRERVPVRVISRHLPYPFKNRLGANLYSRWLFTRLVATSHSVRDRLIQGGVPADRVDMIHSASDVEAFQKTTVPPQDVRRELEIPGDCVVIGISGRISEEKGHLVLLKAAQKLGDRYPLRYVIIGSGPDEASLRRSAQELGVAEKLIWTGFRTDVNNVMGALDIVAVPSTWEEPFGLANVEAMALGKPVVASRIGGMPEIVADEETGLLVPPADPDALADALARLAGDAFLRKRLGQAGRERAQRYFSLPVMVGSIETLYHRELQRARGAAVPAHTPAA